MLGKPETNTIQPVKFPYIGADVLQQQFLFIELDWQQCTDSSCGGNLDLNQLGSVNAGGDAIAQTNAIVTRIEADPAPLLTSTSTLVERHRPDDLA